MSFRLQPWGVRRLSFFFVLFVLAMAVHKLFELKLRHTVGPRLLFLHDLVHDMPLDFILLRLKIRRHDVDSFDDVFSPIDIA